MRTVNLRSVFIIPNTGLENERQNIVFFNQFNTSIRQIVWMTGLLVIAQLKTMTIIKTKC